LQAVHRDAAGWIPSRGREPGGQTHPPASPLKPNIGRLWAGPVRDKTLNLTVERLRASKILWRIPVAPL
jgi:hypothetical protein